MTGTTIKSELSGFTLIELMITVAIIGVLGAIAFPLYSGYVEDSRAAVLQENINTIRLRQEDFVQQRRRFASGTFNPADPNNANGLKARLGWDPGTSGTGTVTYVVVCGTVDSTYFCTKNGGYYVTASDSQHPDEAICMSFGATCP